MRLLFPNPRFLPNPRRVVFAAENAALFAALTIEPSCVSVDWSLLLLLLYKSAAISHPICLQPLQPRSQPSSQPVRNHLHSHLRPSPQQSSQRSSSMQPTTQPSLHSLQPPSQSPSQHSAQHKVHLVAVENIIQDHTTMLPLLLLYNLSIFAALHAASCLGVSQHHHHCTESSNQSALLY